VSSRTGREWLLWLLAHHRCVGLKRVPRVPGAKAIAHSPCDPAELPALVDAHLAGRIPPRDAVARAHGAYRVDDATSLLAYPTQFDAHGRPWSRWLAIDIDGADHITGVGDPWQIALATAEWMHQHRLRPVIERSHGGAGYHVWSLWSIWRPTALAWYVGLRIRHALGDPAATRALTAEPGTAGRLVESYPPTPRPAGRGKCISLPWPGAPKAPKGGRTLWSNGSERPPASIELVPRDNLRPFIQAYNERQRRLTAARRRAAHAAPPRSRHHGRSDRGPVCQDIVRIAEAWGEVTDRDPKRLYLNCPHHASQSRRSLFVELTTNAWQCWSCHAEGTDDGAAGGAAALARWLLSPSRGALLPWKDVYDQLRALEEGRA
jgi:hypothetical protein